MEAERLYVNALVITMDKERRVLERGAVATAGGRITAVGGSAQLEETVQAREVLDCEGDILLPGLVDCMGYAGRTRLYGPSADRPLEGAAHREAHLAAQDAGFWREEGRREAERCLYFGITTAHRLLPQGLALDAAEAYQQAARQAGLRLVLSAAPCLDDGDEAYAARQADYLAFAAGEDRMLCLKAFTAGEVFPDVCTPEKPPAYFARRVGRMEALLQGALPGRRAFAQFYGGELAAYSRALPALAQQPLLVQGLHGATPAEADLMAKAGHGFAHAPQTHLPCNHVVRMLFAGVACGITAASQTERCPPDLLLAGRRAMLEEITRADDYHTLPAGKVLEMLTIDAAAALGLGGGCGSIETGKRADLCRFLWQTPHMAPNFMPVQTVVLRGYGQDIGAVAAGGRHVKQGGRLVPAGKEGRAWKISC